MVAEKTKITSTFSMNLNRLLIENKKSRKDVCRDLDIKYTTFCGWVNGNNIPKASQIERLSDYFHVSSSYFFLEGNTDGDEALINRLMEYSKKSKELPMKMLDELTDEQIRELLESGFRFQHKTLSQYIEESGGELILSEKIDFGKPIGREIW